MIPYLIHLRPLDLLTGQRIDIYVGSASDATALGQGGIEWEPAIARRPRIAQDLMSLDLDGKFKLAAADFVLSLNQIRNHPDPYRLTWGGARLTIYSVADLSWSRRVVEFNGIVSNAPPDLITNRLTVNATVDRTRVDKPLLTNEFTGGGGEGGDATMRGKPMPAGFGYVENVEWVLFDTINNIGMLDGYGNLLSVVKAMEGLNDLGPSVGDYPTYQALKDAITSKAIPPGRWGTCIAKGMVGFGAPLTGRVSFVATFGSNRTGAILKRIMTVHGKIAAVDINSASFDALDAGANVEVRAHWREQIQIADVIEKMCQPLNATPLITVQNQIAVTRAAPTDPVFVLNRNGSSLPVITDWRMADVIDPLYKVIYRVEQPASVFTFEQVNYADDLADLGLYSPDTTYRQGNIVWLADKSQWLYINDTPTKGNLPAAGSAYWKQMQPGTDANTIRYPSGFTLADKEPGEKGANVTETRSAASFYGQGALATQNQLANGSQYLTGFGTLSGLGSLYFGSPYLLESNGGVSAGLGAFKTILGIASSFTGQGALATLSQLALGSQFLTGFGAFAGLSSAGYGSPYLTGFGALSPLSSIAFGSNYLLEQVGGASAGLGAFKTILGIASGFTGQAPAATDYSIASGATRDVVMDTRDQNSPPSYYRVEGRAKRLVMEFKRLDVIGASNVAGFGTLETYASWGDRSGGPVSQRVTDSDGRRFIRYSNGDDTAWTAWQPEYSGNRKPFFGADLLESAGGPLASLSGFKTSLGVASGFAGQGIFATSGPLGRTSIFNGFFNADTFGLGSTLTRNNGAVLTESDAITSLGTSAGFIGQGWGATAAQNKVDNSYSAAGVNVIPNSDQALRKTWRTQYNPNGAVFISQARYASDTWGTENYTLPGKIRNVYTHQEGVASGTVDGAGDGAVAIDHVLFNDDGSTLYCPCAPGDRFIGSVYIASHRCNFQLIVSVVNRSFQQIAGPSSGVATATNNDTNVLAEPYYKRAYVAFDVPAGGAYLALIVRKYNTYGGSPNSFIWFAAPMLERGKPNQNEPSPYSPGGAFSTRDIGYGGDLDATNTGRNTASGIVGQSAWATYASLLPNLVANQVQNLSQAGMLGATKITDTGATSGRYLSTYFPVTTGADKTGNATAAAIAGQGGLATKTKADFGQDVSNIPFAQITSNYFPMGAWTAGQGMNQPAYGLSPNVGPDTYYNFIVVTTGPGGTSQNILKMTSGTSGAGEGGFNHTVQFNAAAGFSAREGYRFSIWAYREGGATGALYFGLQSEPAVYNAADGSGDGNPYFWAGTIPPNKWYLIVGMVQGSDQGNADSGLSGVYDPDTGYRVQAGSDYRLHPSAAWVGMRAYQFYTSGAGSTSYFARPRIERVSEGLPTVASMMSSTALRNADQKWSQVGNDNGGRPAEGADVTRNNTAAGFSGQTAWATLTTTTAVVQKFRSDGTLALGSGGGLASEGYGEWVTNSSAITRFGTAAAIAGQGSFATQSTISSDSQLSGFMSNRLKPYGDDPNYLSASRMAWDDGGNTVQAFKPGEPGSNKTETRTAAAIAGQGGLATRSTVEDGFLSGNLAQRLAPWGPDARYLNANAVAWASGNTVEGLKPEEAGGNRTEGRTAAALAGQSYLATNYPNRLQPSPQHGEGYLAASAMAFAGGYTVENLRPGEPGANVTETRTSAAIVGQSGFATASGIGRDRLFSAGFFALNAFSLGYSITRSDGSTTVTESMTITQLGVAAGFVNQGSLATRNNVNLSDIVSAGLFTSRVNGQGRGFELDNAGLRSYSDNGTLTVELAF